MALGVCPAFAANLTWTNTATGNFTSANSWATATIPGGNDTANFTNSTTSAVTGFTNFLNSSAYVGAFKSGTAGTLTFDIGSGKTWTLTNSFHIATNSANAVAAGMTVILTNGTLAVTNSAGTGLLIIGETGTGTFILNGGTLVVDNLLATNLIGAVKKSTLTLTKGTLTTLHGSSISNNNDFVIGGTAGQSVTWNIRGGTNRIFLTAGNNTLIGSSSRSNMVVVTGTGTVWTNSGDLYVGLTTGAHSNTLVVTSGGCVFNSNAFIGFGGANNEANSNAVIVTGSGSQWINSGTITIGGSAGGNNNALIVTNGGMVVSVGGLVGNTPNDGNRAVVTGSGSTWTNTGTLTVGADQGASSLTISESGQVFSASATIGAGSGGGHAGGQNSVLVTGTNSLWSNTGVLLVGDFIANNTLTITNAGTVLTTNLVVGNQTTSTGNRLDVAGGSLYVTNALGTATLDVRRGTNNLNSGTITVNKLVLTTGATGRFNFNGGNLNVAGTFVTNTLAFVVGDGLGNTATLNLLGGTNNFNNGLTNQTDGFITGGGVVNSPFQVVNLGSIIATSATAELRFTNTTTLGNPGTLGASAGATLTFGSAGVGSTIVTNFGTILLSGGMFRSGNITNLSGGVIQGGGTVTNGSAGNAQVVNLAGARIVADNAATPLQLSSVNTLGNFGSLVISNGGTLTVGNSLGSAVITNANLISLAGGTLRSGNITNLTTGLISGSGTITAAIDNQNFIRGTNGTLSIGTVISGGGTNVADVSGTLQLLGNNTFTGATWMNGGTAVITNDSNLGATTAMVLFNNGGTLQILSNATIAAARSIILGTGGGNFDTSNRTTTVLGVMSGAGGLTKSGTGALILGTNNTYAGVTVISNGVLQVGTGGVSGSLGSGNVTNFASLVFNRSDTATNSSVITGTGSLTQLGSGTLVLATNNTYSGGTTVTNGTLLVNNTSGSGTGSGRVTVKVSGNLGGSGAIAGPVFVENGGTLAPSAGATLTLNNSLVNTGSVIVASSRLVVNGAFTNVGTFHSSAGVGTFNSAVVNSGAWVTDPTTNVFNGNYTMTASGSINASAGDVYLFHSNFVNLSAQSNTWHTLNTTPGTNGASGTKFIFDAYSGVTPTLTQQFYTAGLALTGGFSGSPSPLSNGVQFASVFSGVEGFHDNFALDLLEAGNSATNSLLELLDAFPADTNTAALFVNDLWLFGNSHLIISNNVRLYFVNSNDWTLANITLLGNGQIHQISASALAVPEPGVVFLWLCGALSIHASRRRAQRRRQL